MKRYRIQLPTKELCEAMGIKFDGQVIRTQLWLMGVASGVSYCSGTNRFNVSFVCKTYFYVDCNSSMIINNVRDYLEAYGVKVEELLPERSAFAAHMESLNQPPPDNLAFPPVKLPQFKHAQGSAIPYKHTLA